MLRISTATVATMLDKQRERFASEHLPVLRHDFPELWVHQDDTQILKLLRRQCGEAAKHGIYSARGIYLLLTLRIALGRDFPAGEGNAWAREILCRSGVDEPAKLDAIEAVCWGAAA